MGEWTTPGGLVVRDRRHDRAAFPRDNPPNGQPSGGTVGPDADEGFGDTHVLYPAANPPFQAQAWAGWPVEWAVPSSQTGYPFTQAVEVVGTCVDLVSRSIGDFALVVAKGIDVLETQPVWVDNCEPLLYTSTTEWVKASVLSLLYRGEAFVIATARNAEGFPSRWITADPDRISVDKVGGLTEYKVDGATIDRADVCHVKYQTWPGAVHGVGPLMWAAGEVASALALERYLLELTSRGGVPWAILKHPARLNATQANELRSEWQVGAMSRGGAPAVLSGGIELQMLTLSPKDMALIELLQWDGQRIAAAIGCPPFLVGLPSPNGMNYSSTSMLMALFHLTCLKPLAGNLARALSNWALPRGTTAAFVADAFVEGAFLDHVADWEKLVAAGVASVDEVRAIGRIAARAKISEDGL